MPPHRNCVHSFGLSFHISKERRRNFQQLGNSFNKWQTYLDVGPHGNHRRPQRLQDGLDHGDSYLGHGVSTSLVHLLHLIYTAGHGDTKLQRMRAATNQYHVLKQDSSIIPRYNVVVVHSTFPCHPAPNLRPRHAASNLVHWAITHPTHVKEVLIENPLNAHLHRGGGGRAAATRALQSQFHLKNMWRQESR